MARCSALQAVVARGNLSSHIPDFGRVINGSSAVGGSAPLVSASGADSGSALVCRKALCARGVLLQSSRGLSELSPAFAFLVRATWQRCDISRLSGSSDNTKRAMAHRFKVWDSERCRALRRHFSWRSSLQCIERNLDSSGRRQDSFIRSARDSGRMVGQRRAGDHRLCSLCAGVCSSTRGSLVELRKRSSSTGGSRRSLLGN